MPAPSASSPRYNYPKPWVTYTLLALIIAIFIPMMRQGHGTITDATALRWGDQFAPLIKAGQWWRLITSIFLHGSVEHIAMNGLSLYLFGASMERIYGARRYLIIFLLTGIAGNLLSYEVTLHSAHPNVASLGASGAIFGLLGAGITFPLRWGSLMNPRARKSILSQLSFFLVINIAFSFTPGIDKYAHFGGLIAGALLGLLLLPDVLDDREQSPVREAALWFGCAALTALTAAAGLMQWRVYPHEQSASVALVRYAPSNHWWHFDLPANWKQISAKGSVTVWRGPEQEVLLIDLPAHVNDVNIPEATRELTKQGGVCRTLQVGGQPALLAHFAMAAGVQDLVMTSAYNRVITVTVQSSRAAWPQAHSVLMLILQSIRFVHSPKP